jgi:protoporphyrinogen/coproporphyrinogen III oxidase
VRRVAILGGGISGLAAAFRLQELAAQANRDIHVALYESGTSLGGCIQTHHEHDMVMELGPDSLLVDKPAAASLLRRLDLEHAIVEVRPRAKGARIVHRGHLHRIPADFRLFTPTSFAALLGSGIFSPLGIARAAMEPLIPKRQSRDDETVSSFVTRRFGREVLDRLAQPLIGGIYSGDPQRLSMRATLPQFVEMEQRYGSLLRAMRCTQASAAAPRLAALRDGIGSVVSTLKERIAGEIHMNAHAVALQREGQLWSIAFAARDRVEADAVICALPAYAAAALLHRLHPGLASLLESIRYNSIATINLAYDAAATQHLPICTGFVVPFIEERDITAATFSTLKYPNRSPGDVMLVRAFIGGALAPELVELPDDTLVRIAHNELTQLARIGNAPERALVTRWRRMLPEYAVGHVELAADIKRCAALLGGLSLAGSAYQGVGIPDCIKTGEASAESAFGYIRA